MVSDTVKITCKSPGGLSSGRMVSNLYVPPCLFLIIFWRQPKGHIKLPPFPPATKFDSGQIHPLPNRPHLPCPDGNPPSASTAPLPWTNLPPPFVAAARGRPAPTARTRREGRRRLLRVRPLPAAAADIPSPCVTCGATGRRPPASVVLSVVSDPCRSPSPAATPPCPRIYRRGRL